MPTDLLLKIAETNQWSLIAPELALGVLALALLALEIAFPRLGQTAVPRIAILGQFAILGAVLLGWGSVQTATEAFGGMMLFTGTGEAFRVFFLVASLFVSYLGMVGFENKQVPRIEYFHILLVVTASLMLLAQANHFVMLFVALETATVGFYVLVSYFRTSVYSLEAGLKYLISGALSSAILLFGIVLLYGAGSNPLLDGYSVDPLHFGNLHSFLEANPSDGLALAGMVMVIAGIAFKIGAFPFQIWIPDVYQGSPLATTALLAVASKGAGFAMLLNVVAAFSPLSAWLVPLLSGLAGLTILFGNIAALTQRNVKRLIGLSGVSHAGFLLIGVVAALTTEWAVSAVLFYLFAYLLASMAVFAVMAHMPKEDQAELKLDDFGDLWKRNGFLGLALAVGLGSLAGIPPLAGFIGKALIFVVAYRAGLYGLLAVAIVGVVVSIYYYFGWIKSAFFEVWRFEDEEEGEPVPQAHPGESLQFLGRAAIAIAVAGSVVLGFYQSPISSWIVGP